MKKIKESEGGNKKSWLPGWISRAAPLAPTDSQTDKTGSALSDTPTSTTTGNEGEEGGQLSEEDQLFNELGYGAKDNLFLRDRIFLTLSFSLTGGSFQLVTTPTSLMDSFFGPEPLIELTFEALCFSADLRPRLKYSSFELSLGGVMVQDHSHSDSLFPVLVQPKEAGGVAGGGGGYLFPDHTKKDPLFGLKIVAEEVNRTMLYQ